MNIDFDYKKARSKAWKEKHMTFEVICLFLFIVSTVLSIYVYLNSDTDVTLMFLSVLFFFSSFAGIFYVLIPLIFNFVFKPKKCVLRCNSCTNGKYTFIDKNGFNYFYKFDENRELELNYYYVYKTWKVIYFVGDVCKNQDDLFKTSSYLELLMGKLFNSTKSIINALHGELDEECNVNIKCTKCGELNVVQTKKQLPASIICSKCGEKINIRKDEADSDLDINIVKEDYLVKVKNIEKVISYFSFILNVLFIFGIFIFFGYLFTSFIFYYSADKSVSYYLIFPIWSSVLCWSINLCFDFFDNIKLK